MLQVMSAANLWGMGKTWKVIGFALILGVMPAGLQGREIEEIGFLEDFALSRDREKTLEQLVPGQEQWFFYRALHLLNTERLEEVPPLLEDWAKAHRTESAARRQIRQRYHLQLYESDPQAAIDWLKGELRPNLNAQRQTPGAEPDLPSTLNPELVDFDEVAADLLRRRPNDLQHFAPQALPRLLDRDLTDGQLRKLLDRLERPDHEGLTALILRDLRNRGGRFGSLNIHKNLLLSQLNSLKRDEPSLLGQKDFVTEYLGKLAPREGIEPATNNEEREAYLTRLREFTQELPPSFNTLKAFVLRQRLEFDRSIGRYDRARFLDYLKLPRKFPHIQEELLQKARSGEIVQDFEPWQKQLDLLPPLPPEDPLIEAYLRHFFVDANGWGEFAPYLEEDYLKRVYGETKLLYGVGDPEEWYGLLTPDQLQALRDRVELEFVPDNAKQFDRDDPVRLHLWVKNVPSLIVRTYRINTENYFRQNAEEVTTAVNLDGLVANDEQTNDYPEPPLRRVLRTFEFPGMTGPGVWIVEFIGNGVSSRAVVRKGRLQFVERLSTAGHVFTVYDEKNRKIENPAAWLGNQYFTAEDDGTLTIPFSTDPGEKDLVLVSDGFASLVPFMAHEERYDLDAAFMVLAEQMIPGNKVALQVRAKLFVGAVKDAAVSPALLEDVTVTFEAAESTETFENVTLDEMGLATVEIGVPKNLTEARVRLSAQVPLLTKPGRQEVSGSQFLTMNGISQTQGFRQILLSKGPDGFFAEARGLNGEPLPGLPIEVAVSLLTVNHTIRTHLRTDEKGRIDLGTLKDVNSLQLRPADDEKLHQFAPFLWEGATHIPQTITAPAGEDVFVAYPFGEDFVPEEDVSLLEQRGIEFIRDWNKAISASNGFLKITGLPPGDYSLHFLKDPYRNYRVKIENGERAGNWVLGRVRHLQTLVNAPLRILGVSESGENLEIALANANPVTRVRVEALRYLPPVNSHFGNYFLDHQKIPSKHVSPASLSFESGRRLADEYRYVIERQYAEKFPGNLLTKPSLLLNPWERTETSLQEEKLRAGEDFEGEMPREEAPGISEFTSKWRADGQPGTILGSTDRAITPNLDFLPEPAVVITDLQPDEAGIVRVPLERLKGKPMIRVIAMGPRETAIFPYVRAGEEFSPRDRRLAEAFDPDVPRAQEKRVVILTAGTEKRLEDVGVQDFALYQSLDEVFELYKTLLPDGQSADLAKFSWLLRWPTMSAEERRRQYEDFGGHEVHFFLSRKDPAFFEEVIQPYLENKLEKEFLDEYLLDRDLSRYLQITEFRKLNLVERILLIQRRPEATAETLGYLEDLLELNPITPKERERFFDTALQVQQLSADAFAAGSDMADREANARVQSILNSMIIPNIDFRDATVFDAIEFLRQEIVRQTGGDGINMKLRFPADVGQQRIDLRLTEIPLGDALRYIMHLSGLKYSVGDHGVVIVPGSADLASGGVDPAVSDAVQRESIANEELRRQLVIEEKRKEAMKNIELGIIDGPNEQLQDMKDRAVKEVREPWAPNVQAYADDSARRERVRRFYRAPETTKEFAESYYFQTERANAPSLIPRMNEFWLDYARHLAGKNGEAPFVSRRLAQAAGSATESLLALAVLDLPLTADRDNRADLSMDDAGVITVKTGEAEAEDAANQPAAVLYYKDVSPGELADDANQAVFVSQRFFAADHKWRRVDGQQEFNYVTGDFLAGRVYGGHIVITNPGSGSRNVNVLWQMPEGAIPVGGGEMTEIRPLHLAPFATQQLEFFFYFPQAGEFPLYPVHVSDGRTVLAHGDPQTFRVVPYEEPIDSQSWSYISQMAETDDLFAWLENANLAEISDQLGKMAWRMEDPAVFQRTLEFLRARHIFNSALWAYGLKHNDTQAIREWLEDRPEFLAQTGGLLRSDLIEIDPFPWFLYRHLEYDPLINARRHGLGDRTIILNDQFRAQYEKFLNILKYKPQLTPDDKLALVYYLFLQDRVEEALAWLGEIEPDSVEAGLQHDYLRAYAAFYQDDLPLARELAEKHAEHPVKRWRERFNLVRDQLKDIADLREGQLAARQSRRAGQASEAGQDSDPPRRQIRVPRGMRGDFGRARVIRPAQNSNLTEDHAQLASRETFLNLELFEGQIRLFYDPVEELKVNFYVMDVEMLFSRDPFLVANQGAGQDRSRKESAFSIIEPHLTQVIEPDEEADMTTLEIPEELRGKNLVIEAVADGARQTLPLYSNQLRIHLRENYGQLRVLHAETDQPLSQVYVKVYARTSRENGAEAVFYKDGYTDLRGLFDYAALSNNLIDEVTDLAILVLSPTHGAAVELAEPPQR